MNLYVAVVLEGFAESSNANDEKNCLKPYQIEEFNERWADYDPNGTGFITNIQLVLILFELKKPLGYLKDSIDFKTEKFYS